MLTPPENDSCAVARPLQPNVAELQQNVAVQQFYHKRVMTNRFYP